MSEPARPEKSLEREMRAFHWIRLLSELSGRFAGTDQEGEAARRVESWLRELGFEEIEFASVPSRPRPGWVWAAHFLLAAAGCAIGGALGLVLTGAAALSFRREAAGGGPVLSRIFPARDSQYVVARVGSKRPRRRVVLTAPLDAAPASALFGGRIAERSAARDGDRPPRGLARPPMLLLDLALVVAAASALGAQSIVALSAQAIVGAVLALAALAALRWASARASAGANDASGVAAMLTAAEQLAAQLPPDVELWCAAVGAEHTGSRGMRALIDAHPEWRAGNVAFVNFAWVGGGELHYLTSEGELERVHYPTSLSELARRIAASGSYGSVSPADVAFDTAGRFAARTSPHVLSLVGLEPNGLPSGFRAKSDDPSPIDTELVVRGADFGCCVVSAYLRGDAEPLAYV